MPTKRKVSGKGKSKTKKIVKVVAPVKEPIVIIPEELEIEEPIILLPEYFEEEGIAEKVKDPTWWDKAWKWILA